MTISRKFLARRVWLFAAYVTMTASANAQENYPSRAITLVVHTTAGASSDVTARATADEMGKRLGQQFVVENRAGAGGIIGAEMVAKAAPNGYTLLAGASSVMVMIPAVTKRKLPIDLDTDLIPIGRITHSSGFVLVVNEKSAFKSLRDLIAAAKANPGKITYASAGPATNPHMLGEMLSLLAGVTLNHIAYKGPGPAQTDVLAGAIDCQFDTPSNVLQFIIAKRLRGLVLTGAARYAGLPDVPTAAEVGYPDLYLRGWTGMYAPRDTPAAIVGKLRAALKDVLESERFKARLAALDQELGMLIGDDLLREQRKERDIWRKVATARNIVLE
jgi:tripartite-type tricarboxylate transporter receptor subunit TctC